MDGSVASAEIVDALGTLLLMWKVKDLETIIN
jgi:hypothetical protein